MTNGLDENLTCEFKRKNSFTLSRSCINWKLSSFFWLWKAVFTDSWILKNLTTKQSENSPASGLDALSRVVEKLWAVFNAEKKLFNSAQVAYTKIPRNEAKIYQETDFLSSEGHLLTSPGCHLTLASSLDVVQVRFASWSVYRFLLGNSLSNLSAVSVLSQNYNACTFRLQK